MSLPRIALHLGFRLGHLSHQLLQPKSQVKSTQKTLLKVPRSGLRPELQANHWVLPARQSTVGILPPQSPQTGQLFLDEQDPKRIQWNWLWKHYNKPVQSQDLRSPTRNPI